MFGTYDLLRPEEEKEIQKRPKSPSRTCEDWFSRQGYHQWPAYTPEEGPAYTPPEEGPAGGNDSILGSLEDIKNDLKKHSRKCSYKNDLHHSRKKAQEKEQC